MCGFHEIRSPNRSDCKINQYIYKKSLYNKETIFSIKDLVQNEFLISKLFQSVISLYISAYYEVAKSWLQSLDTGCSGGEVDAADGASECDAREFLQPANRVGGIQERREADRVARWWSCFE